jgi:hypothetical protein
MTAKNKELATAYTLGAVGAVEGVFNYYVRPELTAKRGWVAVGLLVTAYELACPRGELLSEGIDRAMDKHPVAIPAAIGYTALHLMNLLPEELDLFHQGCQAMKGRR